MLKRKSNLNIKKSKSLHSKSFGGELLLHRRKSKRPIEEGKPLHLVLRLKEGLPGLFSPKDSQLRNLILSMAKKHTLKIYDLILNRSHLHAVLLIQERKDYVNFIREVSAKIVAYLSRTIGIALRKIFSNRPFTRVATWGRSFQILRDYMRKNEMESGVLQRIRSDNKINKTQSSDRSGCRQYSTPTEFQFVLQLFLKTLNRLSSYEESSS